MRRSNLKRKKPLLSKKPIKQRPPISSTPIDKKTPRLRNLKEMLTRSAEKKLARASRQAILANLAEEMTPPSLQSSPHQESPLRVSPSTEIGSNSNDASIPSQKVQRTRLAPRSKKNRKRPRNIPYMLWIKTLPCGICGRNGAEAAHTGRRGLGQKAPDEQCIPLCPDHHRHCRDALDVAGPRRFQEIHGIDIEQLIVRLQNAWKLLQNNPPITAFNPAIAELREFV